MTMIYCHLVFLVMSSISSHLHQVPQLISQVTLSSSEECN